MRNGPLLVKFFFLIITKKGIKERFMLPSNRLTRLLILGGIPVLILLLCGVVTLVNYNRLISKNETVSSRYAQVQNLLKERHDKLTQLYATLQGELAEEKAVMTAIANARASYVGETPSSDAAEIGAFNNVVAVVEDNQPYYLSSSGFRTVMDEISEAENKLGVGRKDYNDAVRSYNTSIALFPSNIVAGMFRLNTPKTYWSVDGSDTTMPLFSSPLASS
jgi:LemA protein